MDFRVSVLVVEDETIVRKLLVRLLRRRPCEVSEAQDGLEALRMLRESTFDIIVSDIAMPRLNGLELLEEVKNRFPDTKMILITGHPFEYAATDALSCGAEHLLLKPFKNDDFLKIFDQVAADRAGSTNSAKPENPVPETIG